MTTSFMSSPMMRFTSESVTEGHPDKLDDFEELLAPHRFERVHMSHLVNLLHVRKFLNRDGGTLVLSDGSTVPVSQRKRQQVIEAIGRL